MRRLRSPLTVSIFFVLLLVVMRWLLSISSLNSCLLVFFVMPIVCSAFSYERIVYISLLILWGITVGWGSPWISENAWSSWSCVVPMVFSVFVVTEVIHHFVKTQRKILYGLRANERRYRLLFERLPVGVVHYDCNLHLTAFNNRLVEILQSSRERLLGLDVSTLQDQSLLPCLYDALAGQEGYYEGEYQLPTNSTPISVSLRTAPYSNNAHQVEGGIAILEDITERKRTESALRDSEALFHLLVESMLDSVVILDWDGTLLFANQAGVILLGFDFVDLLVGRNLAEVFHPDFLVAALRDLAFVSEGQGIVQAEYKMRPRTGDERWIEGSISKIRYGGKAAALAVLRDITDRKDAAEKLHESEARNRALLHALPDVIFTFSAHGVFLDYYSSDPAKLFVPPKEFLSRNIYDVLPEDVAEKFLDAFKRVSQTDDLFAFEYMLSVPSGACYFEARVAPYLDNRILCVVRDVTERKRAEENTQRYIERLATLHEIDQDILAVLSPEKIAEAALSRIQHLIPCQQASVVEFDLRGHTAKILARYISPQHRHTGALIPIIEANIEMLGLTPVNIPDLAARPQRSPLEQTLYSEGIRSMISVPLITQSEVIGILYVWEIVAEAFTSDHLEIATQIAASLAVAIRHARLHEQTQQDAKIKARLARDANHRVGNNLSAILGILNTERRYVHINGYSACEELIENLNSRIYGLAALHTMLSKSEWSPLRLSDLCDQIISAALQMLPSDKLVSVSITTSPVRVSPDQASSLALIINELVTNTLKHALKGRSEVQITVEIGLDGDLVVFEFRDNGPGYAEEVLQFGHHGAGLYLLPLFVHDELHGDLVLKNEGGAVATIRFKAVEVRFK